MAAARDLVIGLEQCFGGESFDVLVLGRVEDVVALAPRSDEARQAELRQMLGDCRRLHTDVIGEVVDRMLAVQQRPHDTQTGRVGQQLEGLRGCDELDVSRLLHYLPAHAASVP